MNKLITLEGGEGSGKSTQAKLLLAYLQQNHIAAILTQEPAGTSIGQKIGDILFHRGHSSMCPETELLLFCAARAQHVREVILPALTAGKYVLCDRFSDATFAYQAAGRGLNEDFIALVDDYCAKQLKPGLTLLFDLPPEVGLQRAARRDERLPDPAAIDRFEKEKLDFHNRVRQAYLSRCRTWPGRFRLLDASRTVEEVACEVRRYAREYLFAQNKIS